MYHSLNNDKFEIFMRVKAMFRPLSVQGLPSPSPNLPVVPPCL